MIRNATTSYWESEVRKKKNVSGFWAKNTCPYFGHCLGIVWTSALQLLVGKHGNCLAQTSQATQLKVFLFRRSPFFVAIISYFFCQASMKYMYRQRGHNNSGYMRNEVTVTRQLTHNLIPHARVHYSPSCNRDQWVRSCSNQQRKKCTLSRPASGGGPATIIMSSTLFE